MGNQGVRDKVAYGLIALFSIISFFTSYYGVTQFTGGFEKASNFELIFFGIIVFAIQATLVYSLLEFTSSLKYIVKAISIAIYFSVMLISIFFSYNFYYEVWRSKGYAKEVYSKKIENIQQNLSDYKKSLSIVKTSTSNLSKYSKEKAREEDIIGGTCGASLPGIGPINYLRNYEAKIFLESSSNINKLIENINSEVDNLNKLLENFSPSSDSIPEKEHELNKTVQKMNNYKNTEVIINTIYLLKSHYKDNRTSLQSRNPKNNTQRIISCPDKQVDRRIELVLNSIEKLPTIKKIKLFNPNDDFELFSRSLSVFVNTPKIIHQAIKKENTNENMQLKDTYPLVAGMFVDILILLFGIGIEYRKRNRYSGEFVTQEDSNILESYYSESSFGSKMLEEIRPYLHRTYFKKYLIIPKDQNDYSEKLKRVQKVVTALNSQGIAESHAYNVPIHLLPKSIKKYFQQEFSTNKNSIHYFDIYKIKNRVWKDLILSYYERAKKENR